MTESGVAGAIGPFHYPGHGPNAGTGITLCHGFTGSPLSMLPWAEYLADQGGAVALRVAARHPVSGVAVVNPGLSFYDRRVRYVGALKYFMRTTIPVEEQEPTATPTDDGDYSRTPLSAVHELKKLFRSSYLSLPAVSAPTLVFTSARDSVVPPSSLPMIRRRLGARDFQIVTLLASGHVATLDVDAPTILDESSRFFLQHAANRVASESS
ncbi:MULTISPECIES: carboxylesterase [Arthrobacter]|uniref:Esterase n=1 Tax=Arthrobacter terricola TaxID=2547396 RepID=A0A4R5K8A7_9MICC|nr:MULTISPECIES: esterase [Arthrobacter]MBT8159343.1 esterase [Arthrobacter sp. GN70]TDF91373.1 esterase [Arthrobacter terricola]